MPTWNIVMLEDGQGGGPNTCWSNDVRANLQRLLKVPVSNGIFFPQNEKADIHLITSYTYTKYQAEIDYARKVKANGKKIVVAIGSDARWLVGGQLMGPDGANYTGILAEADAILSEVHPSWKVYGRYQHKVLPLAQPLEPFAFKETTTRDIDVLAAGSNGLGGVPYAVEVGYMVLDKHPDLKYVLAVRPEHLDMFRKSHPRLTFLEASGEEFYKCIARSKVAVNIELKARGGRIPVDGFRTNTPVIASSGAFFSQLYPDLAFDRIDLEFIVDRIEYALNDRTGLVERSKELAKPFYFPEWEKTIYKALGF
jgi:hypothetical protein